MRVVRIYGLYVRVHGKNDILWLKAVNERDIWFLPQGHKIYISMSHLRNTVYNALYVLNFHNISAKNNNLCKMLTLYFPLTL